MPLKKAISYYQKIHFTDRMSGGYCAASSLKSWYADKATQKLYL